MTKPELISAIAEKTGMKKKDAETAVNGLIEVVKETLKKGDKIALIGFGTWAVRERAKRTGVNPKTGKKMTIPEKKVPYFKPGKELKQAVE